MTPSLLPGNRIAVTSVEDGLDFAASLVADAVEARGDKVPAEAAKLLKSLARYVEWRYHSEFGLALEMLADLGNACSSEFRSAVQFWSQMSWLAAEMKLDAERLAALRIPGPVETS